MNPSKSILFKISMAGIITSMCILVFSCFTPKPKIVEDNVMLVLGSMGPNLDGSSQDGGSQAISWVEASNLMSHYMTNNPFLIKNPQNPKLSVPLEGFKIKASGLDSIINYNKIGNGKKPEYVMLYLGKDIQKGYTIIAVGIDSSGYLIIPSNQQDPANAKLSSIYDKAEPCPPMCPKLH